MCVFLHHGDLSWKCKWIRNGLINSPVDQLNSPIAQVPQGGPLDEDEHQLRVTQCCQYEQHPQAHIEQVVIHGGPII